MNYLLVMPKGAAKSPGGYNVFPVGIAYISASLKRNDIHVNTSNLEFCEGNTFEALHDLIYTNNIDAICTSGLSRDYKKISEIIHCARRINPSILTIVGGGIISSDPEIAMSALNADIGVIGEGETTIVELVNALNNSTSYSDIHGLIFKSSHFKFITTTSRTEIDDIDSCPLPDYDGFDYSKYIESINYEAAYILASRSCPFSCTFCFHPSGKKYRQRSLDSLFLEIEYLLTKYKIGTIIISDELFSNNKERILHFCQRIIAYNIKWSVQLRVCDVDKEILQVMRNAGCICISYGLESADNVILRSMKKHITVQQIEVALKDTYDANIDIQGGFIFGDVAETKQTVANTLEWHAMHKRYALELNMINIFPGTALYNYACNQGIINDKIKFLKDGCPLTNISTLSDEEYRSISSLLYEKNMRSKYLPDKYFIRSVTNGEQCTAEIICNKCGHIMICDMNILHNKRIVCNQCYQRHYIDPFQKLTHYEYGIKANFENYCSVAIWGAGEICIKLLDMYSIFHDDKYLIVDISKSRQGYTVCGKYIFSPDVINERNIEALLIAVVDRKHEILNVLEEGYASVKHVYIPSVLKMNNNTVFYFQTVDIT
jgi:anaerobic magnesium-protoporphyrin IX monomethyl ester cyclase